MNNSPTLNLASQTDSIVAYLQSGHRLTPQDSLRLFGSFRLSGRIFDARAKGINVKSQIIETANGKHVAQYWIDPAEPLITPADRKKKPKSITFDRLREVAHQVSNGDLLALSYFSRLIEEVEK